VVTLVHGSIGRSLDRAYVNRNLLEIKLLDIVYIERPKKAVRGGVMRIIAFDRFKPGVTMEQITPYLPEEVSNVWRLWKAGIVRENYARADEPGVVIVFELPSVEAARAYTDDFPLSKAGLLEWQFIALQIPLPIEALFRSEIDINPPFDRSPKEKQDTVHA
jgi:hypothetical protein